MMLRSLTPLILTYNEAYNIERTLSQLTWASRIVIVDSYSTDETINILRSHPQVEIWQREFDNHTNQWNYGLAQVKTEWVLALDADYLMTNSLIEELQNLPENVEVDGYFARFKYCVFGQPLKGTILPPRLVLFKKSNSTYIDDGHTQLLQLSGKSAFLTESIWHDDRKPLTRWLWAQDRYMIIESQKLKQTNSAQLSFGDRIRQQKILAPFIIFIYCLIVKQGLLDGWRGWYYAFQRMLAEIILSIRLIEVEKR
jgi:glycosyltransferase involved in cell wall biosynthesis